MIEKDPRTVLSDVASLERYLDDYLREEGLRFETWVPRFGRDFYAERNATMAAMLRQFDVDAALELACAGPYLARAVLDAVPGVRRYSCTNFSDRMVDFCRDALAADRRCDAALLDAEPGRSADLPARLREGYDLFLTTSLEHIRDDRGLLALLPAGATVACCVAMFDDAEHFRVFESAEDVEARYADVLDLAEVRENAEGNKLLFTGVRRGS